MNQLLAHPEPLAIAGAMLVLLFATSIVIFSQFQTRKKRVKYGQHFDARQKLAGKSYDELKEEFAKAREKLAGKWRQFEVIDIIHDISDNLVGRDSLDQRITFDEAFAVAEQIRAAKDKEVIVVLHTLGGYAFPSEMIAEALKNHPKRTKVYVPYVAMSGGTIIALAASQVFMGKSASLGPIDAQFGPFPADAYDQLVKDKPKEFIADDTLLTSYVVQKYEDGARERAAKLLNGKYGFDPKHKPRRGEKPDEKRMLAVVDKFMDKKLYHGVKISAETAKKKFDMPIAGDCPKEVYTLIDTRLRMLGKAEPPSTTALVLSPLVQSGMPTVMHEAPGTRSVQAPRVVQPQPPSAVPPPKDDPKI